MGAGAGQRCHGVPDTGVLGVAVLPDVRYFGATFFTYVGKALAYLMATPERPDDADNRLIRGFGTEASPDDQVEFRRRFGAELLEGYGSSEGGGAVAHDPDAPPGALGRAAHAGVAVVDPQTLADCPPALLDEHGQVLNSDEAVGEIVDKAGTRMFEGYYKTTMPTPSGSATAGIGPVTSGIGTRRVSCTSPAAVVTGSGSTARTSPR